MIRRRLDNELHGSEGFTSVSRVVAIVGLVFAGLLAAHLATQAWYDNRILPGVKVAGIDLGGKTRDEARRLVQDKTAQYALQMNISGQHYDIKADQLGVSFDGQATVEAAYAAGRQAWFPISSPVNVPMSYTLSRTKLVGLADEIAAKIGTAPVDASVQVLGDQVTPVSDKSGWTVDRLGLVRLIERDLAAPGGTTLELKAREQPADIQAPATITAVTTAKQLMATPITLSYADKTFTPSAADIGQWLTFTKVDIDTKPRLVAQVDSSKIKGYVATIANQIEVAVVPKKVTIENGVSKTTQEGVDGTAIDQDPLIAALTDAVTNNKPLTFTITTHPVPFKTISNTIISLDYGRYIEISIRQQHVWVWQDHTVIFDSPVTTGAPSAGLGTVTGLFSIISKQTDTYLTGVGYRLHVNYWMPFYKGYGMHDAYWRQDLYNAGKISQPFGGQDYINWGSHGCVNMPDATAAFIYGWADVGTPVWVHN